MRSELTDYRNNGQVIDISSEVSVGRVAKNNNNRRRLISSEVGVWFKASDALEQTIASLVSAVLGDSHLLALLWGKTG